jgi:hypothetical protein
MTPVLLNVMLMCASVFDIQASVCKDTYDICVINLVKDEYIDYGLAKAETLCQDTMLKKIDEYLDMKDSWK